MCWVLPSGGFDFDLAPDFKRLSSRLGRAAQHTFERTEAREPREKSMKLRHVRLLGSCRLPDFDAASKQGSSHPLHCSRHAAISPTLLSTRNFMRKDRGKRWRTVAHRFKQANTRNNSILSSSPCLLSWCGKLLILARALLSDAHRVMPLIPDDRIEREANPLGEPVEMN